MTVRGGGIVGGTGPVNGNGGRARWIATCAALLFGGLLPASVGAANPACPPRAALNCPAAVLDAKGCCPLPPEAPQWCAPGQVVQGNCCAAGRTWSSAAKACVDAAAGCRRGAAPLCLLAGDAARALGRKPSLTEAEQLYAKACKAGLTRACVRQAEVQFPAATDAAARARLRGVFERACAAGEPLGCSDLGVYYAYGVDLPADPSRAAALRTDACRKGELDACVDLARQQDDGLGLAEDPSAAVQVWLGACRQWHADACFYAGVRIQQGRGAKADPALAAGLLRRSCEAGHAKACYWIGTALFNGHGAVKDEAAAVPWMAEACARDEAEACMDLGWVTAHGRGVTADPASAKPLLQQACDSGQAAACFYLGELLRDGLGGPADAAKAATLFAKACQNGHSDSCAAQSAIGEDQAVALAQKANTLDKAGRYQEIPPVLDELLRLQEQRYGPNHARVLDLLWQYSKLAYNQGLWPRALEVAEVLLPRLRLATQPRPVSLLEVVEHTAVVALALSRAELALSLCDEALALRQADKTQSTPQDFARLRLRRAESLSILGRAQDAAVELRRALAELPPRSPFHQPLAQYLAKVLTDAGQGNAARQVRQESLAHAEGAGQRPALVEALLDLASDLLQNDEYAAADQHLQRAQQISVAAPALEADLRARVAMALAGVAQGLEQHERCLGHLQHAVDLPDLSTDTAINARRRLAEQLLRMGRVVDANRETDALLRQVKLLGQPGRSGFEALMLLREVRAAAADEPAAAKALDAAEALARANDPRTGLLARVIRIRASVAVEREDRLAALRLTEAVVALEEQRLGPNHRDLLSDLGAAARAAARSGGKVTAQSWLLRIDAMIAANQPVLPSYAAARLAIRARVLSDAGDSSGAKAALDESLAFAEKVWGANSSTVAGVLIQQVILETDPRKQLKLVARALAIYAKTTGMQKQRDDLLGFSLQLLLRVGRDREACAQAAELQARLAVDDVLADCAVIAGDAPKALLHTTRMTERSFAQGAEALDVSKFARLRWLVQRPAQRQAAVDLLRRALEHDDARMARLIATGEALRSHRADLNLRLSLWQALGMLSLGAEEAKALLPIATEAAIRRKGVISEGAARWQAVEKLSASDSSGGARRAMQLRRQLAALALGGGRGMSEAEGHKLTAQLQAELERLETQRGAKLAEAPAVTLAQLQAALPPGAALIDIEPTVTVDLSAAATQVLLDAGPLALVIRRDRPPTWVSLGLAKTWQGEVKALRRALAHPGTPEADELASAVYQRIFAPLQAHLTQVTELIIAPDVPLHLLPWGVLRGADGVRLTESYAIRYVDHPRALLSKNAAIAPRSPPLLLAAPDFGPVDASDAARHFQPLPGTVAEGKALKKLLPQAQLLTGPQVTEAAMAAVRGPSLLHVATHGFFLSDLPTDSLLKGARAAEVFGEASAEAPKAAAQVPHPLLRSGLALAAANRPPSPLGDGLLTALEAADLDLRGTQLVVLSACQTALGDAEPGLGVAGLTSAVQAAGAQSTVLSLWQVDDDATRALMQLFYRGLLAGTSRAQALRQAQAAIAAQSKWRHPFYWAAFVLNGADGPVRIL